MKAKLIGIFGWYGTLAILGAYVLVSFSFIRSDSLTYQLLNLTGAIGIAAISLYKKTYQLGILNIIWTVIALIAIVKIVLSL